MLVTQPEVGAVQPVSIEAIAFLLEARIVVRVQNGAQV